MVKYTLIYFNARGKTEVSRLLFAQAGVDYEDKRLTREQWAPMKPSVPTGQLPVMEIDGVKIPQSMAIARYLAREFSLYGSNNMEATDIDVICDCLNDFLEAGIKAKHSEGEAQVKAEQAFKEKSELLFKHLNDILAKNGTGFCVGKTVSLADFVVYQYLDLITSKIFDTSGKLNGERNKYPELVKHDKKIANLPKIKEWIAKRPVTDF